MTPVRCLSLLRTTTLLSAAFALSFCTATAQKLAEPDNASAATDAAYSSSTDSGTPDVAALPAAPAASGQYDNRTNRGGGGGGGIKDHLTFEVGGGFSAPTSDSSPYIGWGYGLTVGGGYKFNQNLSLMLEYQFMRNGLPGNIVAQAGATDGYDHIWGFSLEPVFDITPKSGIDVYALGGGGFYRKVTNFTDPQQQQFCYYFYCGVGTTNVVVGHFSSNQGGFNIGGGIAHRFAGWNGDGKLKVFAEARYLDVLSPAVTTQPNGLGTTTVGKDTKLIPVTFGVRW